jgi:hypothetical protein
MIDRLKIYPSLSPDERREVDAFVAAHPEYAAAHVEARQLADLFDELRRTQVAEDDVAFVVARKAVNPDAEPYDAALDRAIDEDPSLAALVNVYQARVEALQASVHPGDLFARLTASSSGSTDPVVREPARKLPFMRLISVPARLAVAASVAVMIAIAALLAVEASRMSELERMASFQADELNAARYTMTPRSADTFQLTRTDSLLIEAVEEIRDARVLRFGILTGYRVESIVRAESLLTHVVQTLPADNFVALEARYLRAKTALVRDEPEQAVRDLRVVIELEGARADRARALLDEVELKVSTL